MNGDVAVFLWMMVALKIPIAMLLWLVWYASRAPEPEVADDDNGGGGSDRYGHREPLGPGPSRRGPHGATPPPPPKRVRAAKSRSVERRI